MGMMMLRPRLAGSLAGSLARSLGGVGSLRRRALDSGLWRLGGYGTQQMIRLGGNLVMTRLLVPEDFGLMAIVFALHTGLVMFSDIGVRGSVVRSPHGDTTAFLRTAWTMRVLQFSVLGLLLCAIAGALEVFGPVGRGGSVLGDARFPALLAASAAVLLLSGLQSTALELAARRLQIRRVVALEVAGKVAGLGAMIGFAVLVAPSVWALLAGAVVGGATLCALSHLALRGPAMRLAWDRGHVRDIWGFGKWIIGTSVTEFAVGQGDRFVFAALLDARTFGLYAIAMIWVQAAAPIVQQALRQVGQPILNEIRRENPARLGAGLAKLRRIGDGLSWLGFAVVILVAYGAIERIYPPEYAAGIPLMAILGLRLLTMRYQPLVALALGMGESRALFLWSLPAAAVALIAVPLALEGAGLPLALLLSALAPLASVPGKLAIAARHVTLRKRREGVAFGLLIAFAVLWVVWLSASLDGLG